MPRYRIASLVAVLALLGSTIACGDPATESSEADDSALKKDDALRKQLLGAWTLTDDALNAEVNAQRFHTVIFFADGENGGPAYVRDHFGKASSDPSKRIEGTYFLTAKNLTFRSWRSADPKDYFDDRYSFRFEAAADDERLILGAPKKPSAILRRLPSYCIASASAAADCAETIHSCKNEVEWSCEEHACSAACN